MPLYIMSPYTATLWKIQNDLLALVDYETNFGSTTVGSHTQITFPNPKSSYPDQLLNRLVTSPYPIFIMGYNYSDVPQAAAMLGRPGATIAELGGAVQYCTYDKASLKILSVTIEYDASSCNGELYWCIASDLTKAPSPPYLMIAHEFGHLVSPTIGDVPATTATHQPSTNYGWDQLGAVQTENFVRKAYGCPQRSTSAGVIDQGACGYQGPPCNPPKMPKGSTASKNGRCLVVIAALGSQALPTLNRLRLVRESLLKSSSVGELFFADFDEAYYQTSPSISDTLLANPSFRDATRQWLVEPLASYLATAFALVSRDRLTVSGDLLAEVMPDWPTHRVELAAALVKRLRQSSSGLSEDAFCVSTVIDPLYSAFQILSDALRSYSQPPTVLSWALFEPLEFLWTEWARGADPWDRLDSFVDEWLRRMPISPEYRNIPTQELQRDLTVLKTRIMSDDQFFASLVDNLAHHLGDDLERLRIVEHARSARS